MQANNIFHRLAPAQVVEVIEAEGETTLLLLQTEEEVAIKVATIKTKGIGEIVKAGL